MGTSIKNIINIAILVIAALFAPSSYASRVEKWTYLRAERSLRPDDVALYLNDSADNRVSLRVRGQKISSLKLKDSAGSLEFENRNDRNEPVAIFMVNFSENDGREYKFTFDANSQAFVLSRIRAVPRFWHLDGSDDLDNYSGNEIRKDLSATSFIDTSSPDCKDIKNAPVQMATIKSALSTADFSSKVDRSCSEPQRSSIAQAATTVNDSPDSGTFMGCVRKNVGRNFARMISNLMGRPNSKKMFFCDNRSKTHSDERAETITFGSDSQESRSLSKVVFHEVLHLSGCNDAETSMIERCCGEASNVQNCAQVSSVVSTAVANQSKFCKTKSVGDRQSAEIVDDSQAASALATGEIFSSSKRDPEAKKQGAVQDALPTKMQISLESADQIKSMKPALAKYKESSNVLRKQVAKTLDRMPSLIPTAYARSEARSQSKNGESYVAEPVGFNSNGPVLELPNGELAQVSIPFSQQKGFGEMKVTTVSKASLANFKAKSSGTSGTSMSSESGTSAEETVSRAPSGQERAVYSSKAIASSENSGSSSVPTDVSATPKATASAAPAAPRRSRQSNGGSFADASSTQQNFVFKSWDDAWATLKRSKDPVKILESTAFKNQEFDSAKKRKVSFQGKVYGPADAKRIINLDAYWNPE